MKNNKTRLIPTDLGRMTGFSLLKVGGYWIAKVTATTWLVKDQKLAVISDTARKACDRLCNVINGPKGDA